MKLVLDPAANAEMREAVATAFHQITLHPEMWRKLKGRFRRYIVQRFPYAVIYAPEDDVIYVAAVMHLKRKPGYWQDRVKGG